MCTPEFTMQGQVMTRLSVYLLIQLIAIKVCKGILLILRPCSDQRRELFQVSSLSGLVPNSHGNVA